MAVCPDETGGVFERPALGPGVYVGDGEAFGETVGELGFGGEEEGALALPVGGVDEAGDDGGAVCWCAAIARLAFSQVIHLMNLRLEVRVSVGWGGILGGGEIQP